MLRGRVEKLRAADYPHTFRDPAFRGQVYRLVDLVLDVPSVIETLARRQQEAIFTIDWNQALTQLDVLALGPDVINDTLGALLKYQDDIARIRGSEAARILDEIKAELEVSEAGR